jgi:flavin reductase (DIM6/NTAB) family NADH-FMN oxidoreductase RutF
MNDVIVWQKRLSTAVYNLQDEDVVIMKAAWIDAFGKMSYGIYVLTTSSGEEVNGMIASWVSQISYEPPLVMAAVHPARYSHRLLKKSGVFTINILSQRQSHMVTRFKGPDPMAKFDSIKWVKGKTGCPILEETIGYLECRVKDLYEPGNHTLFIGEVVDADRFSDQAPMTSLDYSGTYLGKS